MFFTKFCCKFLAFFQLFAVKNAENDYFQPAFGVRSTQTLVEIYSKYSTLRFNFGRFKTGTFEQGCQSRSAPPLLLRKFSITSSIFEVSQSLHPVLDQKLLDQILGNGIHLHWPNNFATQNLQQTRKGFDPGTIFRLKLPF